MKLYLKLYYTEMADVILPIANEDALRDRINLAKNTPAVIKIEVYRLSDTYYATRKWTESNPLDSTENMKCAQVKSLQL